MPFYEYQVMDGEKGCDFCRNSFEVLQKISDNHLATCPHCGALVKRIISAPSIGASKSGFDERAKNAGFHKLQRLGKGEYEKKY